MRTRVVPIAALICLIAVSGVLLAGAVTIAWPPDIINPAWREVGRCSLDSEQILFVQKWSGDFYLTVIVIHSAEASGRLPRAFILDADGAKIWSGKLLMLEKRGIVILAGDAFYAYLDIERNLIYLPNGPKVSTVASIPVPESWELGKKVLKRGQPPIFSEQNEEKQ